MCKIAKDQRGKKNFSSYFTVKREQGKSGSVFEFHLLMQTDYSKKKNDSSPNLCLFSLSRKMIFELKREEQTWLRGK